MRRFMSTLVAVLTLTVGGLASGTGSAAAATGMAGTICYHAHVQSLGWLEWKCSGQLAGTEGMGLNLEAARFMTTVPGGMCARERHADEGEFHDYKCVGPNESLSIGWVGKNHPIAEIQVKVGPGRGTKLTGYAHVRDRGNVGHRGGPYEITLGLPGYGRPMEAFALGTY
ncbi:hypothetical protein [Nonomuraea endophytica]|uniref:hypothetical protein n=1 Tax=Nonomuraea endophytica TaxID=714136 RepID=UPI0037C55CE8